MHQSTMRTISLAAALFAAATRATDVLVPCGAIASIYQDEAAVVGNWPECESFYNHANTEQAVPIDSEHPQINSFEACKRDNLAAGGWNCHGQGSAPTKRESSRRSRGCSRNCGGWKSPGGNDGGFNGKREASTNEILNSGPVRDPGGWKQPGVELNYKTDSKRGDFSGEPEKVEERDEKHNEFMSASSLHPGPGKGNYNPLTGSKRSGLGGLGHEPSTDGKREDGDRNPGNYNPGGHKFVVEKRNDIVPPGNHNPGGGRRENVVPTVNYPPGSVVATKRDGRDGDGWKDPAAGTSPNDRRNDAGWKGPGSGGN